MRIHRLLSLTDLVVAGVVAVAIFVPKRPLYAVDAYQKVVGARGTVFDDEDRSDLAVAEARAQAHPDDGALAADLARLLGRARQLDWAVEAAQEGSERASEPTMWRALLATSQAYGDRIEAAEAHAWATRALEACQASKRACPSWEELKIDLYTRYLDAGVKSGIDPRKDPRGFRKAADQALRSIDVSGLDAPGDPTPTPTPAPAGDAGSTDATTTDATTTDATP